ncbi:essential component of the nuclear pore which mediates nuclear import and export [Histomonas meleagridis]|nr:essential component of the nuclear pore which mediates nuclear import and export [Histomonas meleagridis]
MEKQKINLFLSILTCKAHLQKLIVNQQIINHQHLVSALQKQTDAKPTGFSFGSSITDSQKSDAKSTTLSLGTPKTDSQSTDNKSSTFSFGTPKTDSQTTDAKPTGFSFGSSITDSQKSDNKSSTFSFGTPKTDSQATDAKPTGFSFGSSITDSQKSDAKSTTFSLGTPKTDGQATGFNFNFSSQPDKSYQAPTLNFQSQPASDASSSIPLFNLGGMGQPFSFPFSYNFHFGTGEKFTANTKKPFGSPQITFSMQPTNTSSNNDEETPEEEHNEMAEGNTGEEDEEKLIECNVKVFQYAFVQEDELKDGAPKPTETDTLKIIKSEGKDYIYKKKFAERGEGILHFNKGNDYYRIVIRRKSVGAAIVNSRVWDKMKPILKEGKPFIQVLLQNIKKDDKDEKDQVSVYLLKFEDRDTAAKVHAELIKAIEEISK